MPIMSFLGRELLRCRATWGVVLFFRHRARLPGGFIVGKTEKLFRQMANADGGQQEPKEAGQQD